ncbi:RluA family pseudouridine synthase [Aneurinibacillus uraniidurans]|uniref:RluA family pseudouridine synthase n=1 Tax=Aneurinibacillus uraniidurans TaxID=2966586 RepID=UPI00234A0FA2|nr:RluA family pseudouridine synthase [Aneurinibacillus sp. B1]WCN36971.1 RluA family pseudouridine synthase [Aneurinibacillus sp. B1]
MMNQENKIARVLTFIVKEGDEHAENVRSFLRGHHGLSRSLLVELKQTKGILLNGVSTYLDHPLTEGDVIELCLPEEESENIVPQSIPFISLYEDEDVLVVNKEAGMCVHPTMLHPDGTLGNAVVHHWLAQGVSRKFRPVNRLDKDTSGLLIIARSQYAHQQLADVQRAGGIKRQYEAFVHGIISKDEGVIDAPIKRRDGSIMERMVHPDGQWARTNYTVLGRYQGFTHVRLVLETGRTHQIRVHMSHIGHPLLGDDLYGGTQEKIKRQALHSRRLSFPHPHTKEWLSFEAPLPPDMEAIKR